MEPRYDHITSEKDAQQLWESAQTYTMKNNPGPAYTIDTPPPTVSGKLHIGHVFSYTQTDILARYKRMNGFSVFYPFGFDDNGLATERYVENKRSIKGHELKRSEFIQICIQEAQEASQEFVHLWQRMGLSIDWNNVYSTISDETRKISQTSFIELYKKGYLYRKQEPALYCTTCRTSVAQAELDDAQLPSLFNNIIFKDEHGKDLIVATTRPELLPSCVALLFNPADERYKKLKGAKAHVPLFDIEVPIIEDELVDMAKGSGLVMVCTFGDKTDIIWYKKHNLPYRQSIGMDGKFVKGISFLEGLKVADARTLVLANLREKNLLLNQQEITHSVGTHERCKKAIEFMILPQWFIEILPYKKKFLEIADQIEWYPAFMKARYNDWVENLAWDWCISRQRFYGIPFPAWHCQNCGEILLADVKDLPIDPQETPYKGSCPACSSSSIVPDTDVMDTWNTSSLTPYLCYNLTKNNNAEPFFDPNIHEFLPMSMRPQAHDIIRTWAFDTIVKAWMHHEIAPWNSIVISGHVLSDKSQKLSKKEGNAMEPAILLEQYPADAIRYWTASGRLGQDIQFSPDQLKIGSRLITKLWNAFRFAHPHLENFETPHSAPDMLDATNKWLLHTITACFKTYSSYFEQQEFGLALDTVEQFFWRDFCDNYLELIKNQLFNPQEYKQEQIYATRWTLYHAGLRILQLYAPYLSHVTETIYGLIYQKHEQKRSIHQTNYATVQVPYVFEHESAIMTVAISIVTQVRKLKSEQKLSLKVPIEKLHVYAKDSTTIEKLKLQNQLLRGVTQAVTIEYTVGEITAHLRQENELWLAQVFASQ